MLNCHEHFLLSSSSTGSCPTSVPRRSPTARKSTSTWVECGRLQSPRLWALFIVLPCDRTSTGSARRRICLSCSLWSKPTSSSGRRRKRSSLPSSIELWEPFCAAWSTSTRVLLWSSVRRPQCPSSLCRQLIVLLCHLIAINTVTCTLFTKESLKYMFWVAEFVFRVQTLNSQRC